MQQSFSMLLIFSMHWNYCRHQTVASKDQDDLIDTNLDQPVLEIDIVEPLIENLSRLKLFCLIRESTTDDSPHTQA